MVKTLIWDIECTNLDADWGTVLAIGYKWVGEKKAHVIAITDFPGWRKNHYDDSKVIKEFLKVLAEAEIEVGHNTTLFDIPFIQARMLKNGLGYWPVVGHVDTYQIARHKIRISRKSLDNVARFLGCKHKKTAVDADMWLAAQQRGDPTAISYIVKHCEADVRVAEEVYLKLRPTMRSHPVIGSYGACHVCQSNKLQRRGYFTTTARGRQVRLCCTTCGAWTHRPEGSLKAQT